MPTLSLVARSRRVLAEWKSALAPLCALAKTSTALGCFTLILSVQHAAAQPSAEARFDVLEYRVEGNSTLSVESIERAVYRFLGEKRTVADVEAARTALEVAYREAGFGTVVVDTPEQRVTDGVVILQVVEAPVARLRVIGSKYFSQGRILDAVPALAEGTVPNFKVATEELAAVNRSADRRVTPVLRPGKTPGTTEVDLMVEDKSPLHASVELNNKSSPNTTPARLQASVRYDNLWQLDHSIGVQAQVSPQDTSQVKVLSGSYSVPIGTGLLIMSAIRSDSNTVAGVGGTSIFGKGSIFGLRRVVILGSDPDFSQTLTYGGDYKDFTESVSVGANQGFNTPVRYLPLTLSYSATSIGKSGTWQAGTSLELAVRGLASRQSQFDDKRFMAQSNFSILKLDLARTQNLAGGISLYGKLEAQLSDQALISNEQFVAGGVDSVRGYLEATAVGDKALRATLEVRSDNLVGDRWPDIGGLRVHAFVDAAALRLNSPLPAQTSRFYLAGSGIGLRLQARTAGSLALDLAWPLHDAGQAKAGSPRLHASGVWEF